MEIHPRRPPGGPPRTRPPGARIPDAANPHLPQYFCNHIYTYINICIKYDLTGFLLFDILLTIIICTKNLISYNYLILALA